MGKLNQRQPFDQYSRQYFAKLFIERIFPPNTLTSVIDLGGHKGNTADLLPKTVRLTILDVFDLKYEGYVKGDATNTVFKDNEFSLATSFDVFEHIPRKKRPQFLMEASRISKYGTVIAAPFNGEEKKTSKAEVASNGLYKSINKKDHQWLKEHIDYKIPTVNEFEGMLRDNNLLFTSLASNPIDQWELMQNLIFASTALGRDSKYVVDVNEWYNKNISLLEDGVSKNAYRRIYFITNKQRWHERAQSAKKSLAISSSKTTPETDNRSLITSRAFLALSRIIKDNVTENKYLKEKTKLMEIDYAKLAGQKKKVTNELNEYKKSKVHQSLYKIRHTLRELLRK